MRDGPLAPLVLVHCPLPFKEAAKEAEECAGGGISSAPKADLSYLIPAAPVSA